MKICSLLPSGTEILFALGLGDAVIGVSDLCVYPPEAATKPIVSRSRIDVDSMSSEEVEQRMREILAAGESPYELDVEWLWENPPDVVLTQDLCYFCEVDASTVGRAVEGMPSCPEVVVLQPKTMSEIMQSILDVGTACGAEAEARRLVEDLSQRVTAVAERLAMTEDRPRTYSLEGINPLVIGGHWIPEMLTMAGGDSPYAPGCPARRVPWDEVRAYAPDKLFIDLCSSDVSRSLREIPWLAEQEGWSDVPSVKAGEVYLINHEYFSCPGPRVVQGLEILAELTHPDLFRGMVPHGAVVKMEQSVDAPPAPTQIAGRFAPYPEVAGVDARPG